jgi:hypothetical protein
MLATETKSSLVKPFSYTLSVSDLRGGLETRPYLFITLNRSELGRRLKTNK